MIKFETLNELTLKVTCDGQGELFTKAGAYIAGEAYGGKNYKFDKVLLGPNGGLAQQALGFVSRKLSGENLPLMRVICNGPSITYYANEAQHVTVLRLQPGQQLSVESENILGFIDCDYSVRFLATGVVSQKGLMTSVLRGRSAQSQVAVLTDGNPIVLSNMQNGSFITVDPDAMVCFIGTDPTIGFDVGFKTLLGSKGRSGESYFLQWQGQVTVIVQPNERVSGIDIGIDGKGGKPTSQNNNLFRQGGNQGLNAIGNMAGGNMGGLGGLGGMLGGLMNS